MNVICDDDMLMMVMMIFVLVLVTYLRQNPKIANKLFCMQKLANSRPIYEQFVQIAHFGHFNTIIRHVLSLDLEHHRTDLQFECKWHRNKVPYNGNYHIPIVFLRRWNSPF